MYFHYTGERASLQYKRFKIVLREIFVDVSAFCRLYKAITIGQFVKKKDRNKALEEMTDFQTAILKILNLNLFEGKLPPKIYINYAFINFVMRMILFHDQDTFTSQKLFNIQ